MKLNKKKAEDQQHEWQEIQRRQECVIVVESLTKNDWGPECDTKDLKTKTKAINFGDFKFNTLI